MRASAQIDVHTIPTARIMLTRRMTHTHAVWPPPIWLVFIATHAFAAKTAENPLRSVLRTLLHARSIACSSDRGAKLAKVPRELELFRHADMRIRAPRRQAKPNQAKSSHARHTTMPHRSMHMHMHSNTHTYTRTALAVMKTTAPS